MGWESTMKDRVSSTALAYQWKSRIRWLNGGQGNKLIKNQWYKTLDARQSFHKNI